MAQKTDSLATRDLLREQPWFNELPADERSAVAKETKELQVAMMNHGFSGLSVGEHLANLQALLEPKRCFVKYLRNFNFSMKTAYRYIGRYRNASERIPEPILKAAMARGLRLGGDSDSRPLGIYTDAIDKMPPPKTQNPEKINAYLDELELTARKLRTRKGMEEIESDPDVMAKECFRYFDQRFRRLPANHKTKAAWIRTLIGMLMAELGLGNQQSFAPIAIPREYRAVRGRPRKDVA